MAQANVIWRKRILVPFWVVRILCMLIIIAASAIALKLIADEPEDFVKPAIGYVSTKTQLPMMANQIAGLSLYS
jgi:hypothetical protein